MIYKLLIICLFIIVPGLEVAAQELYIDNIDANKGSFFYSEGDSIYISGNNNKVAFKDSVVFEVGAPKIIIGKDFIADSLSFGRVVAYYEDYEKLKVVPNIIELPGDTIGDVFLEILDGVPPYNVSWLSYGQNDSALLSVWGDYGYDLDSIITHIQSEYSGLSLQGFPIGNYNFIVEDATGRRENLNTCIGNTNHLLQFNNCSLVSGNIEKTDQSSWDKCGFYYDTYFNQKSNWCFQAVLTKQNETLSVGLKDTIVFPNDSTDYIAGVYVHNGYLIPISNKKLVCDTIFYAGKSILQLLSTEESFVIKLNNKTVYSSSFHSNEYVCLSGSILNGSLMDLTFPIVAEPIPLIVPETILDVTHIKCGLSNVGRICTNRPGRVTWSDNSNGECITGLNPGTYSCVIDRFPILGTETRDVTVGCEVEWATTSLEIIGYSGLCSPSVVGSGVAYSNQEFPVGTDNWIEFQVELDPTGTPLILGLTNNTNQTPYCNIVFTVDGNGTPLWGATTGLYSPISLMPLGNATTHKVKLGVNSAGTHFYVWINDYMVFSGLISSPSSLYPYVSLSGSNKINSSISSVVCEETLPYYSLTQNPGSQLYPVENNKLRFKFEEPFFEVDGFREECYIQRLSEGSIPNEVMVPYSMVEKVVRGNSSSSPGYREFTIDLNMLVNIGFEQGDHGLLRLTNSKGENWYLKFIVK